MEDDQKQLTSEESLRIITNMISNAKGNIRGSAFHFLLWGWVVTIANLGHFYLWEYTSYEHPYIVWLIAIPAWIASMLHGYRQSKRQSVQTYSDGLIMWIWLAFTFTLVIIIFSGLFYQHLPALILALVALPTFMTGLTIRFRPLIIGGSSFWIFSVIAFLVGPTYSLLVSAAAIIVGYLIPGYLLRKNNA